MDWYYAENNHRIGPLTNEQMNDALQDGKITANTLIWRTGLKDWMSYKDYLQMISPQKTPPQQESVSARPLTDAEPMEAEPAPKRALSQPTAGSKQCAQCKRSFSTEDMIRYGQSYICANCKPLFVQKLKEGAPTATSLRYAGFWIRFVAKFADGIIYTLISQVFGFAIGFLLNVVTQGQTNQFLGLAITMLINLGIGIAYTVYFLGKFAATPGKMIFKLKVIRSDASPISYQRALARYFAEVVSSLTLTIGYLMAAFDKEEHRALHDRICDTRVVYNE
jgi:uncharacterized RDD family membrane protein YckC